MDLQGKKLLLISANRYVNPYPVYPLGLSYLTTYLRERIPSLEIRIFDFNLDSPEDFTKELLSFKPDYTALSLRNIDDVNFYSKESFINGYYAIIALIRETLSVPLIIGGSGFSIYPRELFSLFKPDFGIQGEGEESLFRLLVSLDQGKP
ncbi:MAG TPA: cobalamin-dependent protein, partial [Bacteroidales bacterium]|nr:cobalamin-dependent protein [Bacteroidales bacterium]